MTIDLEYTATWKQRHRHESTITLVMTTIDHHSGPMNRRSHYQPTTTRVVKIITCSFFLLFGMKSQLQCSRDDATESITVAVDRK